TVDFSFPFHHGRFSSPFLHPQATMFPFSIVGFSRSFPFSLPSSTTRYRRTSRTSGRQRPCQSNATSVSTERRVYFSTGCLHAPSLLQMLCRVYSSSHVVSPRLLFQQRAASVHPSDDVS